MTEETQQKEVEMSQPGMPPAHRNQALLDKMAQGIHDFYLAELGEFICADNPNPLWLQAMVKRTMDIVFESCGRTATSPMAFELKRLRDIIAAQSAEATEVGQA